MSSCNRKVVVEHIRGEKTKNRKSYINSAVEQKPENIIPHTGTNDLKNIDTPGEIAMGILS